MLGWIGGFCLAICGLPLVIRTIRDGHAKGVDGIFLLLWFIGEVCALLYSMDKNVLPIILNYGLNIVFIGIVIYYKLRPNS